MVVLPVDHETQLAAPDPNDPARTGRDVDDLVEDLRRLLLDHLAVIGLSGSNGVDEAARFLAEKERIRKAHASHRVEVAQREAILVREAGQRLLNHFAEGTEIDAAAITPELVPVESGTEEAQLFRVATLLWSVPVSRGFGRRLRLLVRDRSNGKLIGLLALGSPVFNLNARDAWIGWTVRDREVRLVNVMDAYVIGAVPPYSQLIGGKLVAALVGAAELGELFDRRHGLRRGIISGEVRQARLALVTTTSALGRSSLYNRLQLPGMVKFHRLGMTGGWGHFQIPDAIFARMRDLLELEAHRYSSGHRYGDGPNWRLRVVRVALKRLGLDENLLCHGIKREVYGVPLAENWRQYLRGEEAEARLDRASAEEIGRACVERWLLPRSQRDPGFLSWTRRDTWQLISRHWIEAVSG